MAGFRLKSLGRDSRPPAVSATVTQRGVTLTFSGAVETLVNWQGNTFIKGPVTLTSYSPSAYGVGASARNGAMINPGPQVDGIYKNGFDGRVDVANCDYQDAYNMGLGLPRVLNPGDTLIVATSLNPTLPTDSWNNFNCVSKYETFTIVDTLPGSTSAFRPPVCVGPKPIYYLEDMNTSLLGFYTSTVDPFVASPPWSKNDPKTVYSEGLYDLLNDSGGITARFAASDQNQWYPAYRYGALNQLMIYTYCNFADRNTMAARIVQAGIDLRYQVLAGWNFSGGAGFGGSRACTSLYAGKLLGDPILSGTTTHWLDIPGTEATQTIPATWPFAPDGSFYYGEQASHYYSPNPFSGYVYPPSYNPAGKGGFANAWPLYGDNGTSLAANHSGRDPAGVYNGCGPSSKYQYYDASNTFNNIGPAGAYMHCCSNRYWTTGVLAMRMLGIQDKLKSPALLDFTDWWAYDDTLAIPAGETASDYTRDIWKFGGSGNLFLKKFWDANR